jgi:Tol biopolymer transport system component
MLSRLLLSAVLLLSLPSPAVAGARAVSPVRDGNAINPLWSPDGSQLAYEVTSPQDRVTDLYILDVNGGREELVTPPASSSGLGGRFRERKQVNHEFTWAPRKGLYAFASSGDKDEFDIYVNGVTVPIGSEEKEGGATFSRDSRHLVFSSARSGEGDLYLLDIFELERAPIRLTQGEGLDFYAVFGAGGSLAYAAMTEDGANIRVIDDVARPERTDRPLTSWKATQLKPSWSPDGRRVAFFSNHLKEDRTRFDLYVAAASGDGVPQRVAENVIPNERRGPSWTPDGRRLVTVLDDANAGDPVALVEIATGRVIPQNTGTVNNAEADVTADERGRLRIAFVSQGKRAGEEQAWRRVWVFETE